MGGLVRNIETWSLNHEDTELLDLVKKELKDPKSDVNKLSKNLKGDLEIAPIHAAAASKSLELFKLVLETEAIDPDPKFLRGGIACGGILDYAVREHNIDIIQMALEKIIIKNWVADITDGTAVAGCLYTAVENDQLDIVDLLLSKGEQYEQLNIIDCLSAAIRLNRGKIFSHLLPSALKQINNLVGDSLVGGNKITLLHLAVKYNRVKMLRQLVEAESDVNVKDASGFTPLMIALILAASHCLDVCYEIIISELLSSKSIDLDVMIKQGTEDVRALDLLTEKTCPHVRKIVEQAYTRDIYRKKLEKRKERETEEASTVPSKNEGDDRTKSEKLERKAEDKICWRCSVHPEQVKLFRCKGCRKAWYCGEKCQEDDWPVHGPWCEMRMSKREEKHKAKEVEPKRKMSEVFYELD